MQRFQNPNLTPGGIIKPTPIYSKIGGTIAQRVRGAFTWTNIFIIVILLAVFLLVAYMIYKQYAPSNTAFNANREGAGQANTAGNSTATLMLFYVDWCPHCKTAKPEWDALKAEYETKTINGYTIVFEEHNCTVEGPETEKLMDKYKIEGYPTIKLIKDNQVIEYDAKPTKSTMEQFLNTVL